MIPMLGTDDVSVWGIVTSTVTFSYTILVPSAG
jgi:hypothetical protein